MMCSKSEKCPQHFVRNTTTSRAQDLQHLASMTLDVFKKSRRRDWQVSTLTQSWDWYNFIICSMNFDTYLRGILLCVARLTWLPPQLISPETGFSGSWIQPRGWIYGWPWSPWVRRDFANPQVDHKFLAGHVAWLTFQHSVRSKKKSSRWSWACLPRAWMLTLQGPRIWARRIGVVIGWSLTVVSLARGRGKHWFRGWRWSWDQRSSFAAFHNDKSLQIEWTVFRAAGTDQNEVWIGKTRKRGRTRRRSRKSAPKHSSFQKESLRKDRQPPTRQKVQWFSRPLGKSKCRACPIQTA